MAVELRSRTWRGVPVDTLSTGEGVYLLHYTRGHPGNGRGVRHYIGWSPRLRRRVLGHRSGTSWAVFPRAMLVVGIRFRVARAWHGAPVTFEKALKARK